MKIMLNARGTVAPLGKHQIFQMIPKVSLPSNHKHGQCANFGLMFSGDLDFEVKHVRSLHSLADCKCMHVRHLCTHTPG